MARKLCVALWHVLQDHTIGTLERLDTLQTKLGKLPPSWSLLAIKGLGYESKSAFIEQKLLSPKKLSLRIKKMVRGNSKRS